jgi:hypothetical protein
LSDAKGKQSEAEICMFVTAPAQLIQCPDFESPDEAASREQRERKRKKGKIT